MAATVKLALCPASANWFVGCRVMIGSITDKVATELVMLPPALLTINAYDPASPPSTLLNVSVGVPEPEMFPASARGMPSLSHWQVNGGVPPLLVRLAGEVTTTAGPPKVSTNELDPSYSPLVTKPRARMFRTWARGRLVNCQPPGARCPAPKLTQSTPLVEMSKVVRQTSGPVPPRCHEMVELSKDKSCVARPVLKRRPMFVRDSPPRVAKLPPTRMAPSF